MSIVTIFDGDNTHIYLAIYVLSTCIIVRIKKYLDCISKSYLIPF
jgi:hypothetical protein